MWTPERIRELRRRCGERQDEFCKRFRVSIQSVQTWEQGKGEPSGPVTLLLDQLEAKLNELQTA